MARRLSLLLTFVLLVTGGRLHATGHTYYLSGDAADVPARETEGALLLMGGGGDVDEAFRWFARKAGGGDVVVLRASGADGYNDYLFRRIGGVNSVETILFHDRTAANDERVLALIRGAEAIWLAGGDQGRYVTYWRGTPVQEALNAHVRAGKPLGGTSAGLAVLGEFSFSALEPGSLTSEIALQDPFDRRITLERDFLRFDLLRGAITDSHFMPRGRLGRSLVFLARLLATEERPRLYGIGVDEKTALAIDADGTARVFRAGPDGRVWLLLPSARATVLEAQRPLSLPPVQVIGLGPDSRFSFRTFAVESPATVSTVTVQDGKLSTR